MRTLLQRTSTRLAALLVLLCFAVNANAQVTTELLREDFSNGMPKGWEQTGYMGDFGNGWYWIEEGFGDYNGSVKMDIWNWAEAVLHTPSMDLSMYANDADEVIVEFDLWLEYNQEHRDYGMEDYFSFGVDGNVLLEANTLDYYTYYSDNYYTGQVTTGEKDWRHFKIKIPSKLLSSDFQLEFSGGWYSKYSLSDPAIDNVVITATHYTSYSYDPQSINFGQYSLGSQSDIFYVTLFNTNDFDVKLHSTMLQGPGAEMYEITEAPDYIPAGTQDEPGKAVIGVRFNAMQFGSHAAELTFYGEVDKNQLGTVSLLGSAVAPEISLNEISTLFAKQRTRLGEYADTFVVVCHSSNIGTLSISPETHISGTYANQYSVLSIPEEPLLPGQCDTIWLRHNPTYEGGRGAQLQIVSNAGNGTQTVQLRGVGILQRFTITPSVFNFDSTEMMEKVCQPFRIYNPGTDTLRIQDIYFGSADQDFTIEGLDANDMVIAPEQAREITICFEPRRMGYRQARLRILTNIPYTFEDPARDTSDFVVNIQGTGVPFGALTFGNYELDSNIVGMEICQTDTLWNTGDYSMTIYSANIVGANASEFSIKDATFPLTIPAGGFTTVTMCATPGERGLRDAAIVAITESNSRRDTITLPLAVYGQVVCADPSVLALFNESLTLVGKSDSMMVTITNCGDIAAAYTATLPSGNTAYSIIGNATSPVIAPGATHDFWVRFTPATRGAITSNLAVTAPNVTPMNITLAGTGAGVTAAHNAITITPTVVGETSTFTVTVTNNGNIDWTTGTPLVTGAGYTTASTGLTLAPGASGDITFTFAPTVVGANGASVTFPNADPLEAPAFVINLNGQGLQSSSVDRTALNGFELDQNYPNPVNGTTTISFTTPRAAMVTISVVDMTGAVIKTVAAQNFPMGANTVELDASEFAQGTYLYVLTSEGVQLTRQMTIVK